jgi:hypothetical protein
MSNAPAGIGHNGGPSLAPRPHDPAALLPHNATEWERAIALTGAARRPLPADLIKSVWNPRTCPLPLLPYLAWALSVDVWDETWSETKKREVVAKSIELHQLKTTAAGIKRHVALTGAEVLHLVRPPARAFARAAYTDEARRIWRESLPSIQMRTHVQTAIARHRAFYSGRQGRTFGGTMRRSRGLDLWGRRAMYVVDGVAVPVRLEQVQAPGALPYDRITLARSARRRSFHGATHYGRGHWQTSTAAAAVLTVRIAPHAESYAVEPTDGRVVDVRADRIHQRRIAPRHRAFAGRTHYGHGHAQVTVAPRYIYDRIALHDPARAPAKRKTRTFWNAARYGITPFTAEALIKVPLRRPPSRANRFWTRGFAKRANLQPLWNAIDAVRVSKAARDTIYIGTTTSHALTLRDAPLLGFTLGERRPARRGQTLH